MPEKKLRWSLTFFYKFLEYPMNKNMGFEVILVRICFPTRIAEPLTNISSMNKNMDFEGILV